MRPPLVIIGQEEHEGASEGSLIPDDHVIETLSPQGPDQALDERVLPRATRGSHDFLDTKTLQQATHVGSVAAVAIPQEVRRCGLVWKGFPDLLPRPGGGRMVGHVEMNDASGFSAQFRDPDDCASPTTSAAASP
jgi:hypothetical protein